MDDGQANLAVTACQRCREQKVRCSHEQPKCAKCARLRLPCTYPEPPDRRLIASRRMQARKTPALDSTERDSQRDQRKRRRTEWHPEDAAHPQPPPPGASLSFYSLQPPGSRRELRKILQDTYLSCAFNASLIFRVPTFEQADAQSLVPRHTLLAMHAYSAHVISRLPPHDQRHHALAWELGEARRIGEVSEAWALEAGKLALQEADQPTLYMIQTCQVLSLYWFSQGDSKRNTMFSGIGYRAVRSIVVDSKDTLIPIVRPCDPPGTAHPVDLDKEALKRLFWASWITNVINSDHYTPGSAADTLVLTLPLPVSEDAFLQSTDEQGTASPATIAQSGGPTGAQAPVPSIMAEIMKVMMIWARIRDHIDMRRSFPQREAWVNAFALQSDIAAWAAQLHPDLAYSKRNLYRQLVINQQPIYAMLHALHHQCYLVLSASQVPHFSGLAMARDMPREVVQMSAAIALRSARSLSELGAHLLALEWDPAQIAPFVGYCMYVAASVQISVLPRGSGSNSSNTGGGAAWGNMINCLKLLKLMRPYWAVLDKLWARILRLYDAQVASTRTVPITPAGEIDAEQEYLESPERPTGDLEEPLEDSVLHYSLRNLKKSVSTNGGSPSAQGLENAVALGADREVADRVIQGSAGNPRHMGPPQQQYSQMHKQGFLETLASTFSPSVLPAQATQQQQQHHHESLESFANVSQSPLTSFAPLDMHSLDEFDWFQLDMDNSAQVREALNDLF